jgi:hypothetical protein
MPLFSPGSVLIDPAFVLRFPMDLRDLDPASRRLSVALAGDGPDCLARVVLESHFHFVVPLDSSSISKASFVVKRGLKKVPRFLQAVLVGHAQGFARLVGGFRFGFDVTLAQGGDEDAPEVAVFLLQGEFVGFQGFLLIGGEPYSLAFHKTSMPQASFVVKGDLKKSPLD